jgi:hypothetical protein
VTDSKRFVRNRTGQGVHLKGHGVIQPGKDGVDVSDADQEAVEGLIEQKVLEESEAPKDEAPRQGGRRTATDKDKEGGQ